MAGDSLHAPGGKRDSFGILCPRGTAGWEYSRELTVPEEPSVPDGQ